MNDYPAWMLVKENGKGKKNLGETEGRDETFQSQESGESLSRSRIFVACQSRFGGCTRTITSLRTTSL